MKTDSSSALTTSSPTRVRCINLDWLEVHAFEPIDQPHDVDYFTSCGFVVSVRDYVVEKCNYLSGMMERDELGNIVYDGDMEVVAVECMQSLGNEYKQLAGYYPKPKKICFSGFLSQQYMLASHILSYY